MADMYILAIDLAKRSFQVCATDWGGAVLYNRMVSRAKLEQLLEAQTPGIMAMEACATALRGHLAEFGVVVAQGPAHLKSVPDLLRDDAIDLPDGVRDIARLYLEQIEVLTGKIDELTLRLREAIKVNDEMRRLCTVPGVGPVTAGAIMAFAPDLRTFSGGRNFAAWLGLVPRQRSTGGKTRLGAVSKMGQSDIRKLLIVGAMSCIRWIVRRGVLSDNWLGHLLGRKPRMVAAVALANKMARIIWAMMAREEITAWRDPLPSIDGNAVSARDHGPGKEVD